MLHMIKNFRYLFIFQIIFIADYAMSSMVPSSSISPALRPSQDALSKTSSQKATNPLKFSSTQTASALFRSPKTPSTSAIHPKLQKNPLTPFTSIPPHFRKVIDSKHPSPQKMSCLVPHFTGHSLAPASKRQTSLLAH